MTSILGISIIIIGVISLHFAFIGSQNQVVDDVNTQEFINTNSTSIWGADIPLIGGIISMISSMLSFISSVISAFTILPSLFPSQFKIVWTILGFAIMIGVYRLIWGNK